MTEPITRRTPHHRPRPTTTTHLNSPYRNDSRPPYAQPRVESPRTESHGLNATERIHRALFSDYTPQRSIDSRSVR